MGSDPATNTQVVPQTAADGNCAPCEIDSILMYFISFEGNDLFPVSKGFVWFSILLLRSFFAFVRCPGEEGVKQVCTGSVVGANKY